MNTNPHFDPFNKEKQLREESTRWDTTRPEQALESDIPVIDLADYFTTGSTASLNVVADAVRIACEQTGFFTIVGHQIPAAQMASIFSAVRSFHALPLSIKESVLMDHPDRPAGGIGYLPIKNRKLPSRDKGNLNEAFIVKSDGQISLDQNPWPPEQELAGFKTTVKQYANAIENLGKRLLPIFATALEMPADFFDEAFEQPLYRLRMTHYPPVGNQVSDEFGIAPHVDTTFCTILAQDQPGLTIFSERRRTWIQAPVLTDAFIVNSGELLRQWTNDRFLSVKHFANNNVGDTSRYSIPFFFNANPHYPMACVPSCSGPDNPAKYPTITYAESQAVAQGE